MPARSASDPGVFSAMEKTKLVTVRDLEVEDPIPCNGCNAF